MPKKLEYDQSEKDMLFEEYVMNGMSRDGIMRKYGYSKKQLATRLAMYGIRKPEVDITKEELAKEYIGMNMPRKDIAAKHGVSDAEIKKLLKEYGIRKEPAKVQENVKATIQAKYGVDYPLQRADIRGKSIGTMIGKYGVGNSRQIPGVDEKIHATLKERYGDPNYNNREKARQTMIERYGVEHAMQDLGIREKAMATTEKHYGAKCYLISDDCLSKLGCKIKYSKPNNDFAAKLDAAGIEYEREFRLSIRSYDFKVGDDLIEIDPFATHNSTWSCFGKDSDPLPPDYHHDKSELAAKNGYRCIHVFDWDDQGKIIELLKKKTPIAARKLKVAEIDSGKAAEFLNEHHLQGSCKGQTVCMALIDGDDIIQVMTFGKPRYNNHYDYELLRLCTKSGFAVIGGAERLLKHFMKRHPGKSIISYCDESKFSGKVYERLGFSLKRKARPSRHWYNPETGSHITDNLLKQRGFDQLFGASYGKGTSNADLMICAGYVEVFDAGQATYAIESAGV